MNLPNKLTILRVLLVPVFAVLYLYELYIPALIVFIIASLTDMLDGRIARKRGLITNFGKIMDPLADKVLVYAAFCLFIQTGVMPGWMLIVILAREFAVAGMRAVAASEGIVVAAGLSGKIKTVLQMIAVPLLIVADLHPVINIAGQVILWASLVMTVYSGAEYIIQNKQVFAD
ncbi:MAG TPA: CDP-diacylglycerol--glycerol-3-phosphate 3-phosphatidyltransferase [Bacillota bacterium]|nr:CDP-diacylglycerol--glycerol-3-phosphate 3-phosphatidyltransferase [Bacillota bacterium]